MAEGGEGEEEDEEDEDVESDCCCICEEKRGFSELMTAVYAFTAEKKSPNRTKRSAKAGKGKRNGAQKRGPN